MRIMIFAAVLSALLSGCTTADKPSPQMRVHRSIALSDVEQLKIGATSDEELRTRFGEPYVKRSLSAQEEAWFYGASGEGGFSQRVGFILDKTKRVLLATTWIPGGLDPLHTKDAALEHFKGLGFEAKDVGWIARHEYSDDTTYTSDVAGVSFTVRRMTGTVSDISFSPPQASPLAKQDR